VQFVAAAPFRRARLLIAEHREVLAVGRLGADDLIPQHVAGGVHLVRRDHRPLRVAEQPRVDPGKVPEVGEVLHLPRRVAAPPVRPGGDNRPLAACFQLGDFRERPPRLLKRYPDQPVPFLYPERPDPGPDRDRGRILLLRDRRAPAVRAVPPAVVGANQFVALDPAQRQCGAAVYAQIGHHPRRPAGPAPDHQRLTEQVGSHRAVSDLTSERDRMPARPLGGQVSEHSR